MENIIMSKNPPLLSIAMTTYNGEDFLVQQIDSILNQTYQNFELIICDDCSTDNTISIIKRYINKHANIKLFQNTVQLGSVKNFEQAIRLSKGEYIALSDQDDIWRTDKLQIEMKYIKTLEEQYTAIPLMVHSDLSMIDENNVHIASSYFKFKNYTLEEKKDLSHILGPCGVMGNTILMNRLLKDHILPFPPSLAVHDYWIALINELYGKRSTLHQPLVAYRIHQKNLSNSQQHIKVTLLSKFKRSLTLDFSLPYMEIEREKVLHYLLDNYLISKNDKILIHKFISYLEHKENRLSTFFTLIHNKFVKKGFWYRYELLIKLLFTRRYL